MTQRGGARQSVSRGRRIDRFGFFVLEAFRKGNPSLTEGAEGAEQELVVNLVGSFKSLALQVSRCTPIGTTGKPFRTKLSVLSFAR